MAKSHKSPTEPRSDQQ